VRLKYTFFKKGGIRMQKKNYVEQVYNHLHLIPETGFKEFETSKFIAEELKKCGYDVLEGILGTGVIATMSSEVNGPILAIRADMDALEYEFEGKTVNLHTCGHDANSSMVLATAKEVAEVGIQKGKAVFIFQPAEEILGGADGISKSGVIDDVEEIIGIHLRPIQEAKLGEATPALCHGASNSIEVTVRGLASHGARPHLGINAIDAAVLAVSAINSVKVDPRVPHSAKVTQFNSAGKTHNVIPDRVTLVLDLRAQTNEVMSVLIERLVEAITSSVKSIGATAEIVVGPGVPAAEYDDEMVHITKEAITEVLGSTLAPIVTPGGEDFHYYAKNLSVKTAYVGLGADLIPGLHNPDMKFDTKALEHGTEILKKIVYKRLG